MDAFIPRSVTDQLADHLRDQILQGALTGTMPGIKYLANTLGVSPNTLLASVKQLERQGLVVPQGPGRASKIVLPKRDLQTPSLRVAVLRYMVLAESPLMISLRHYLEEAGHVPFYADKTLSELNMDVRRVSKFVEKTEADAWVVVAGSRDVLEWFSQQKKPAFALFGRRYNLPIAGGGPDKETAMCQATRRLIELGHRRISLLVNPQHRKPEPAKSVRGFLSELQSAGIRAGEFNLPDWEASPEAFAEVINALLGLSPATALILDEATLYHAAYHQVTAKGLRVPEDISLVSTDWDLSYSWCRPPISCVRWDRHPMMRRIVRWANNNARGQEDRQQSNFKAEFVEGGTIGPVRK
jgi:DNA-binding LacI/PurR family transcriptional regulator